jgi:8-oxo-dGTP pyrophosphatase MutT (NUDIX family)
MSTESEWVCQAAAIPLQGKKTCLVTSRSGKRWVIPKGLIDPGKTAAEIALQEAWEEAGLVGLISPEPVGSYFYQKYGGTCHVTVFLLQVTQAADNWPERSIRERAWLSAAEAASRLEDAGLRELVQAHVSGAR